MTREADMIDQPLVLQFSGGRQAAVLPAALPEGTMVVESVQGQKIQPVTVGHGMKAVIESR